MQKKALLWPQHTSFNYVKESFVMAHDTSLALQNNYNVIIKVK